MKRNDRHNRGLTLVEVMITVTIVAILGLAILSTLIFGIHVKQAIRERNGASRVAADLMESTRRIPFANLSKQTFTDVVIDDRGTTDKTSDDVTATVNLQFFDLDENEATETWTEVGTVANPVPLDRSMIKAQVSVVWQPAGRRKSETQTFVISSLLSP